MRDQTFVNTQKGASVSAQGHQNSTMNKPLQGLAHSVHAPQTNPPQAVSGNTKGRQGGRSERRLQGLGDSKYAPKTATQQGLGDSKFAPKATTQKGLGDSKHAPKTDALKRPQQGLGDSKYAPKTITQQGGLGDSKYAPKTITQKGLGDSKHVPKANAQQGLGDSKYAPKPDAPKRPQQGLGDSKYAPKADTLQAVPSNQKTQQNDVPKQSQQSVGGSAQAPQEMSRQAVSNLIQDELLNLANRSKFSLSDSKHAPKKNVALQPVSSSHKSQQNNAPKHPQQSLGGSIHAPKKPQQTLSGSIHAPKQSQQSLDGSVHAPKQPVQTLGGSVHAPQEMSRQAVSDLIQDELMNLANRSKFSLSDSKHAPKKNASLQPISSNHNSQQKEVVAKQPQQSLGGSVHAPQEMSRQAISDLIQDQLMNLANRSKFNLSDSKHAPKANSRAAGAQAIHNAPAQSTQKTFYSPFLNQPIMTGPFSSNAQGSQDVDGGKEFDDPSAFMAAMKSRRAGNPTGVVVIGPGAPRRRASPPLNPGASSFSPSSQSAAKKTSALNPGAKTFAPTSSVEGSPKSSSSFVSSVKSVDENTPVVGSIPSTASFGAVSNEYVPLSPVTVGAPNKVFATSELFVKPGANKAIPIVAPMSKSAGNILKHSEPAVVTVVKPGASKAIPIVAPMSKSVDSILKHSEPNVVPFVKPRANKAIPIVAPMSKSSDNIPECVEPSLSPVIKPAVIPIVKPVINPIVKPTVVSVDKPAVGPVDKPDVDPTVKLAVSPMAKPVADSAIKPTVALVKPVLDPSVKPAVISVKTVVDSTIDPTAFSVAKPAVVPVVKPAVESVESVEPAIDSATNPTVVYVKSAVDSAIKPAVDFAVKPALVPVKPAVRPVVKPTVVPAIKPSGNQIFDAPMATSLAIVTVSDKTNVSSQMAAKSSGRESSFKAPVPPQASSTLQAAPMKTSNLLSTTPAAFGVTSSSPFNDSSSFMAAIRARRLAQAPAGVKLQTVPLRTTSTPRSPVESATPITKPVIAVERTSPTSAAAYPVPAPTAESTVTAKTLLPASASKSSAPAPAVESIVAVARTSPTPAVVSPAPTPTAGSIVTAKRISPALESSAAAPAVESIVTAERTSPTSAAVRPGPAPAADSTVTAKTILPASASKSPAPAPAVEPIHASPTIKRTTSAPAVQHVAPVITKPTTRVVSTSTFDDSSSFMAAVRAKRLAQSQPIPTGSVSTKSTEQKSAASTTKHSVPISNNPHVIKTAPAAVQSSASAVEEKSVLKPPVDISSVQVANSSVSLIAGPTVTEANSKAELPMSTSSKPQGLIIHTESTAPVVHKSETPVEVSVGHVLSEPCSPPPSPPPVIQSVPAFTVSSYVDTSAPIVVRIPSSGKVTPEPTTNVASECSAKVTPESKTKVTPMTTKKAIPETTKKVIPETTKKAIPETTKKVIPETTKKAIPESTKKVTPQSTKVTSHTNPFQALGDFTVKTAGQSSSAFMEAVRARRNIAKATKPNDSKPTHSAGESSKAESSGDLATSSPDNSNDIIIATNLKERINAMYFTSWGSPEPRPANRPRPEHRRVILQNLPESHRTPTSVLSLVHGGSIERVGVIPSGSAHVTFTESKACVTYYEQYRQTGIRLPGGHVVRVTRGKEEIANSVTRGYLDKGVTRVVRISSLPLEVSMGVLVELAVDNGRQLEKIEDTYTREGGRAVVVRFLRLEDGAHFRSALGRHAVFRGKAVGFATDPCAVATRPFS